MRRLILISALFLSGCSVMLPPPIANHHWRRTPFGCTLYKDSGEEAASFISGGSLGSAQACVFDPYDGCKYFDSDRAALDYIASEYKDQK